MYIPAYHGQLTSGDPYGGVDCTAWSESYAIDFASSGARRTTGTRVRALSNEPIPDPASPGLNLAQVDAVGTGHFSSPLEVRYEYPITHARERIHDDNVAAHIQGYYSPIADTRFNAGRGFKKNHDMLWLPGDIIMDPLADGRAVGVYKFHAEAYPFALISSYAGRLNVSHVPGGYSALGPGLCYVAFTAPQKIVLWEASVHPVAGEKYRHFGVYTVSGTTITATSERRTRGFSARCTAPRLYSWPTHTSQLLVRLLTGSRGDEALGAGKGLYIRAAYAERVS